MLIDAAPQSKKASAASRKCAQLLVGVAIPVLPRGSALIELAAWRERTLPRRRRDSAPAVPRGHQLGRAATQLILVAPNLLLASLGQSEVGMKTGHRTRLTHFWTDASGLAQRGDDDV